jgi:hypothetical protein
MTHFNRVTHAEAYTPTDAAIAAYRAYEVDPIMEPEPTVAQVRLVAEHLQEYINERTFPAEPITYLRRRVVYIKTLDDLADWLWDCRKFARLEPL